MATKLLNRRSSTAGSVPTTTGLEFGEIAINTADGFLFIKRDDGTGEEVLTFKAATDVQTSEQLITVDTFAGDGSTSSFTLSAAPAADQSAFVTINGAAQHVDAYSVTGNTISFTGTPALNDDIEVRIVNVSTASLQLRDYKSYVYTITDPTSTITGADDDGDTLAYELDKVEVYYNGVKLVPGYDFTANNGTSITLLDNVDDCTIEVVSLARASFANSGAGDGKFNVSLATTATQLADKFLAGNYRSAKYIVQMTNGTDYHTTEVLVMHDGTDAYITEYGTMYTTNSLGTVSADISGAYVRLLVTPANTTETVVKGSRVVVAV